MNATARLAVALALTACVALIECIGGFVSHSVTLLSDSAHVAMDVLALAIALAARQQAGRPATPRQSYGFARMEVLAALGNGALLFTVTAFIVVEALRRLAQPQLPNGIEMATIAAIGLAINVAVGLTLVVHSGAAHDADDHDHGHAHHHHGHSHDHSQLNMRAALLHVIGDALGGVAAVIGGLVVHSFQIQWLDPILSLGVAVVIFIGIARIVRESIEVLLESAPSHADINTVRAHFLSLPGVVEVHDLHIWTLSGAEYLLSAHVVLEDRQISEASMILRVIEDSLRAAYSITHVTLQFECESCEDNDRIVCTQR
jgi:cobalt-zinc-cadmium efflux system protein